jgi:23S rRNA (uridine2552-2'-O)-methyltransferase
VGERTQVATLFTGKIHETSLSFKKEGLYCMKPSKTSKAWLQEHVNDHYVHLAKQQGYRSRAAFKLLEIQDKDKLLKPGMTVVDLGAAPGSWAQVAAKIVGDKGHVYALDILPMDGIPNVTFLQGDFREVSVLEEFQALLAGRKTDLVISDIAPNITGNAVTDQARSMYLAELALDFALAHLTDNGYFLVKVFQGYDFQAFQQQMRSSFKTVVSRKPKASRDRSAEIYLLGKGLSMCKKL